MSSHKKIAFGLGLLLLLIISRPSVAVNFTGNALDDFPPESCHADPAGISLAFPASFPAGSLSGFDVDRICLVYNKPTDTLQVGIITFNDAQGAPIPFGDADGDGDPGHTSTALAEKGGTDWPDLSQEEFFAWLIDFDADLTTPPEVIAGVSAQATLPEGYRVSEVALPHPGINFSFNSSYYGAALPQSSQSRIFTSPSQEHPHLEFDLRGFTTFPGFLNLDPFDPDQSVLFIFKAGSLGDTVLGEEDMRLLISPYDFFDTDGDDLLNSVDQDQDNDGIPDLVEQGLDGYDLNHDGHLDAGEIAASHLDKDGDGDIDKHDGITFPDSDGDQIPDYLDTDSDNDGILDQDEVLLGTNPTQSDTDGDGTSDGEEVGQGSDPNFPEEQAKPTPAEVSADPDDTIQYQGSGLVSCALITASASPTAPHDTFHPEGIICLLLALLFFIRYRIRHLARLFFLGLLLLVSREGLALNAEHFRPHFDNLGLVNLMDAHTLPARSWSAGLGLDYAHNPMELGSSSSGGRSGSLVDYQVNMTLTGAYGLVDWAEVGIVLPFFPALRYQPLGAPSGLTSAAFGDVGLAAKFGLWRYEPSETLSMGAAVSPFLTFPSGDGGKFTGDSSVTGGVGGAYDILFKDNKLVANLGFRFREKENFLNLSIGQELLYGLGYTRPIWRPWDLHVLTEWSGSSALNGLFSNSNRSPMEWLVGLRKKFSDTGVQFTTGASMGITNGYGVPDFRVFAQFAYAAPPIQRHEEPVAKTPTSNSYVRLEGGKIVILEPIHFETARWTILPDSLPVVQAIADLMKGQPQVRHVVVKGHTDARGNDKANQILSQRRAQAVVTQLITYGVEKDRLSFEGWGKSQPIAPNKTPAGMAKNRRVEFHITEWQQMN